MASTLFSINPTTGRGNTTVNVSVNEVNSGTQDKVATVTVSNGANSDTVTLRQKYCPYFVQFASTTFPASGGDIYFTIHSEYDVVFRSVPNWITISDGHGTTFYEGQRISSGTVDGQTFTLTADANTGDARTVAATFNMGHYIGLTLQNRVTYFSFTQEAYVPPTPTGQTWTASNAGDYEIYGNLLDHSGVTFAGVELAPREDEVKKNELPQTIAEVWLAVYGLDVQANCEVWVYNGRTGEEIIASYVSGNDFIGTGSIEIQEDDYINFVVRTETRGRAQVEPDVTEEEPEEEEEK